MVGKFSWYQLFNKTEFEATGLVSATSTIVFKDVGVKTVLITKANSLGVTIDDVFLPLEMNQKNPFRIGERAIWLDEADNVWWGIFNAD